MQVTGLELQPDLAELAAANIRDNDLEDRVHILTGDLLSPPADLPASSFDRVMSNPPFQKAGTHTPPPGASRALAHGEGSADLAARVALLHPDAEATRHLTLVHRADRLDDLIALLHGRFGAVTLIPSGLESAAPPSVSWSPPAGAPAAPRLALSAGLTLHEADGGFTAAAEAILRHRNALAP